MYIVEYMHVYSHKNTNVPLSETIKSLSLNCISSSFCFLFTPHSKFCHPSQVLFLTSLLSHYSLCPVKNLCNFTLSSSGYSLPTSGHLFHIMVIGATGSPVCSDGPRRSWSSCFFLVGPLVPGQGGKAVDRISSGRWMFVPVCSGSSAWSSSPDPSLCPTCSSHSAVCVG